MKGTTTKFIAALAVFAMVFAGFGAVLVADGNDAAKQQDIIPASIVVADSMDIGYIEDEGDLYIALTADLSLADTETKAPKEGFITYHLAGFVKTVSAFYSDAVFTFTIPYELPGKKVISDIVPAGFLDYFTDTDFTITVDALVVEDEEGWEDLVAEFAVLALMEKTYTAIDFDENAIDLLAVSMIATGVDVLTVEEIEAIEATIELMAATIEADDAEIAELEAQIVALEAQVADATAKIAELEAQVAADAAAIAEKDAKIAELEAKIVEDQLTIEGLQIYIKELEDSTGGVIAALKEKVAELTAKIEDDVKVIDEKNTQIALDKEEIAIKDAKIAELEKQVAEKKGGDATVAWCVAAVGIIAAVVLAGFVLIVFNKANKEGRRLI